MENKFIRTLAMGWNLGRTVHFAAQQRLFPLLEILATGQPGWRPENIGEKRRLLLKSAYELLQQDATNIANGVYPLEVLRPEAPWRHGLRFTRILRDAFSVATRKRKRDHEHFSPEASRRLAKMPEYYRRNFHFQTDGYLSESSAELYDHQVDILFGGATDAMRRSLLAPLKRLLPENPKLFEVGCGTGRLTRFASLTFPQGKISAVDPSKPYLEAARALNRDSKNIRFKQRFAENMRLSDGSFSAVYSCFVFHELPRSVRRGIIKQMIKALQPGGLIAIVDSLQIGDRPEFDWALKRFPTDFHEPFYADYSKDKMENWVKDFSELEVVECSTHFLSKLVVFRKIK